MRKLEYFAVIGMSVLSGCFLFGLGFLEGKWSAERYWQAHQVKCESVATLPDLRYLNCDSKDNSPCTATLLCPDWDNSCGFKREDWPVIKQGEVMVCNEHGCKKLIGGGGCLGADGYGHPCDRNNIQAKP